MTRQAPAIDKLSALGLDAVCAGLADGRSMTRIAEDAGVSFGALSAWIEADAERSARTREARRATARMWDEKAAEAIEAAPDAFALAKARDLASHYRWRASKIAPAEYGDKVTQQHVGAGGGPVLVGAVDVSPPETREEWIARRNKELAAS